MKIFDASISGSLQVSGSANFANDLIVSGTITGSFKGDGSQLFGIPAGNVIGLNLDRLSDASAEARITNANGLRINRNR